MQVVEQCVMATRAQSYHHEVKQLHYMKAKSLPKVCAEGAERLLQQERNACNATTAERKSAQHRHGRHGSAVQAEEKYKQRGWESRW